MLIAANLNGPRKMLILGLQQENIDHLLNDRPILKNLATDVKVPGLEEWDITILGPEDTARFIAHFGIFGRD